MINRWVKLKNKVNIIKHRCKLNKTTLKLN